MMRALSPRLWLMLIGLLVLSAGCIPLSADEDLSSRVPSPTRTVPSRVKETSTATSTPTLEGWIDPFATPISVRITVTSEPGVGVWIGWSVYADYESLDRFAMWFDESEWELAPTMDVLPPLLLHRSLDHCSMMSVGGHGLGPGWIHSNVFRKVGGAEVHTLELFYQGELRYINYSVGEEVGYFTLVQVGPAPSQIDPDSSEMLSENCRKAAERVLETFMVVSPHD